MQLSKILLLILGLYTITFIGQDFTSNQNENKSIIIDCLSDSYKQKITEFLPNNFHTKTVTYEIDFLYENKDLAYLTGLKNNSDFSIEKLFSACFYLKQLDRFKKIDLVITQDKSSYSLHFKLIGQQIFAKLLLSGCMRDRDFYKNMYLIDVSEIFDISKHNHSIDLIKQYFYDKGYCNASVIDTIKENKDNKTISIKLEISKGLKFLIKDVSFDVQAIGSIADVDVMKMKHKIEDACLKRLKDKVYSQELIKKITGKIKFLLERYGFMNFNITFNKDLNTKTNSVSIKCNVTLDQKKEFVFFGNHFFKRQEILDHLLLYGKSSWHFPSSIIIDELVQLYKSRGYWNVSVSIREEKNRVFCLINEGTRIGVASVTFTGNDTFHTNDLEKQIFKRFINCKYYDKDSLNKSLDGLINFYKQHGFWDIKIIKQEFIPIIPNTTYSLSLTIDEGQRRKIGSYSIIDYPELQKQGPFSINKDGIDFDQIILIEQKQWLLRHFRNLGYNKVGADCQLQENNDELDIIWKITLHEKEIKFGKVILIGNTIVPKSKIMREVNFKQGDSWDKSKIEETSKKLRDLSIFDLVQIYPSKETDENLEKPIFIKVIDGSRYELRTKLGFQQVGKDFRLGKGSTYKIGGSFFIRNPFNVCDTFIFEGDFTRYYRNAAISYQFPWLFTKSIKCQYKLYDTLYDQPVYIGSKNSLYQAGQRGVLFNITKNFKKTTLSNNLGIEFMGIKEAGQPELQNIIDYDKNLIGKKIGYLFVEPNLMWQNTDNILNPTQGHLSFLSCKSMIDLDTKTSFFKLLAEHSFFLPLLDNIVLAVRMRGGHVFNRKYNQLIPIERFYLGGASTLRGYERDYCPPLGKLTCPVKDEYNQLPTAAGNCWRFAPQGGRTMMNLNTELRFKIFKGLGGVIFNDIGALFKDSINNTLKDHSDTFLGGTGFGLRYNTPIGPLRFDVGFKWNRVHKDFESRCVWYLTLGHAF